MGRSTHHVQAVRQRGGEWVEPMRGRVRMEREGVEVDKEGEECPGVAKERRTEAAGQVCVSSWAAGQHEGGVLPVHHHGGGECDDHPHSLWTWPQGETGSEQRETASKMSKQSSKSEDSTNPKSKKLIGSQK